MYTLPNYALGIPSDRRRRCRCLLSPYPQPLSLVPSPSAVVAACAWMSIASEDELAIIEVIDGSSGGGENERERMGGPICDRCSFVLSSPTNVHSPHERMCISCV